MDSPKELAAMRRALELAARGPVRGANPRVGCVVLDAAGEVAGEGWHRGAGTPHAEVEALAHSGADARGGTAVVTLEPCSHTGRTPPCAEALIAAGLKRVVIATADPNPAAAGGAVALTAAGIDVQLGLLADEAAELNHRWLHAVTAGRPFVTWKFAATLDGRSAAADGSSRWITGEAARLDVHRRRGDVDAIVVGTGTVLADDPSLTVRGPDDDLAGYQPLRVVVGERDLPAGTRVLDGAAPTLQLRTRDLASVMATLAEREVRTVWLEGGPRLAAAFWAAGLVDEVLAYLAPTLLGDGTAAVGSLGITTIGDAARLQLQHVHRIGGDVLMIAAPARARADCTTTDCTPTDCTTTDCTTTDCTTTKGKH